MFTFVMFSFRQFSYAAPFFRKVLVWLFLFAVGASSLHAETASAGIAWRVQGTWQAGGKGVPIRAGDAIQPASLLQPDAAGDHSITIFLPDGQRVLYECFTVADCARGFRVPSLISKPDAFAVQMLAGIRTALSRRYQGASNGHNAEATTQTSRDEAVAMLEVANRVHVAGLLVQLPNGRYTYDLRPLNHAYPPQFRLVMEKTAPSVYLSLPASGLYDITITDAFDTPRIDLFLAAITPAQSADFASFQHAKAVMAKWNSDNAGWPIHDFLRAYLESLMQSAKPLRSAQ
jgi:hypothetical protein